MLHFILGRAGAGKTHLIKERIREYTQNRSGKAVLLVPEQSTLVTEREILEFAGNESGAICEVLSFKRLCHRVFSQTGGIAALYADRGAQNLIMGLVLNEVYDNLTVYKQVSLKTELIESVNRAVTSFKMHNITPQRLYALSKKEEIDPNLQRKLSDLSLIFGAFETMLNKSYQDPRDDLTRLAQALAQCDYLDGKTVFIDGFWSFTPQEMQVIRAMLKRKTDLYVSLCLDREEKTKHSVFMPAAKTYNTLCRMAKEESTKITERKLDTGRRFSNNELAFLEQHLFSPKGAAYGDKTTSLFLHSAQNPFAEAEFAARTIMRLVMEQGYSYGDFAVVSRDLSEQAKILGAVFSRAGIPYFLDTRTDILTKPVLLLVLSALDAVKGNFEAEDILRCVKTGLYTVTKEEGDLLENYVLLWNIRGKKWESEFVLHPGGFLQEFSESDKELLTRLNDIRKRIIAPLFELKQKVSNGGKVRDMVLCLYEFMSAIGLQKKIKELSSRLYQEKELDMALEYAQLWDILVKVMEQLVKAAGEVFMDFTRFCANFRLILSGYDIGIIPTSLDEVTVGDAKRIRPGPIRCLIILGLNDGVFPKIEPSDSLLGDDELEQLELSDGFPLPSGRQKLFEEEFLFYILASLPSDYLFLSYQKAKMDGQSLSPSRLIGRIQNIFPQLTVSDDDFFDIRENIFLKKELLGAVGKGYQKMARGLSVGSEEGSVMAAALNDPTLKEQAERLKETALFGNRPWLKEKNRLDKEIFYESASKIEQYYSCRFSYFMKYMLGAKPRRVMEFSTLEIGNFVHSVLEEFFLYIRQRNIPVKELDGKRAKEIAGGIVNGVIARNFVGIDSASPRYRYLFSRILKTILAIVENMTEEFMYSEFEPVEFELPIGDNDGGIAAFETETKEGVKVRITGKVDRIDGYEKDGRLYVRIVDYKTGTKVFSFGDVLNGLNLQMLIYLFAVCKYGNERYKKEVRPAAVLYLHVSEPDIPLPKTATDEQIKKQIVRHYRMNGIVVADDEIISAMEKDMDRQGRFIPVKVGKEGYAGDTLVNPGQMGRLYDHVEKLIGGMAEDLRRGDISISPYINPKGFVPCSYCDYKEACLFDMRHGQNFFKKIKNVNSAEFFEMISGGEKDGSTVDRPADRRD